MAEPKYKDPKYKDPRSCDSLCELSITELVDNHMLGRKNPIEQLVGEDGVRHDYVRYNDMFNLIRTYDGILRRRILQTITDAVGNGKR